MAPVPHEQVPRINGRGPLRSTMAPPRQCWPEAPHTPPAEPGRSAAGLVERSLGTGDISVLMPASESQLLKRDSSEREREGSAGQRCQGRRGRHSFRGVCWQVVAGRENQNHFLFVAQDVSHSKKPIRHVNSRLRSFPLGQCRVVQLG